MRIKGEQLYLFAGDMGAELRPIALSTDCALRLDADAVEVVRKLPSVRRFRKGLKSWGIDCSNFTSLAEFNSLPLLVGQPITIAITLLQRGVVEAGIDLQGVTPDETVTLVGESIITSISTNGSKGQVSAYQMTFQGNGEIGALVERGGFPYVLPIIF